MKGPHIYLDAELLPGTAISLPPSAANHLRVLRLRPGDTVRLFNGDGAEYPARVLRLERRDAELQVLNRIAVDRESPLRITLVQGISKGERMDYTIQKAVELGVARVLPVFTERSVVQLAGDRLQKRHEHWQGVIVAACEQSGRNTLPELLSPRPLAAALSALEPHDARLVLAPDGDLTLKNVGVTSAQPITLLIGPEGGFTAEELEQAERHGFKALRLGPRVLRTETAGVAALAALQLLGGDLG